MCFKICFVISWSATRSIFNLASILQNAMQMCSWEAAYLAIQHASVHLESLAKLLLPVAPSPCDALFTVPSVQWKVQVQAHHQSLLNGASLERLLPQRGCAFFACSSVILVLFNEEWFIGHQLQIWYQLLSSIPSLVLRLYVMVWNGYVWHCTF